MALRLYREYQLKFYLNARHYITIDGKAGETHPHTWEFSLDIRIGRGVFTPFMIFEQGINRFMLPYQNRTVNEIPPFHEILPTLENIADYFAREFYRVIDDVGGELRRVEVSETPSRSYILNLGQDTQGGEKPKDMPLLVNSILDNILAGGQE